MCADHGRKAAWRRAHPAESAAADAARRTGVLDVSEFIRVWHEPCCCCGERTGGVDRVDSRRPYQAGNMQSLCWVCNRAKQKDSQAEFHYWRAQIVHKYLFDNNLKAVPKE